jgi:hypothetical protein
MLLLLGEAFLYSISFIITTYYFTTYYFTTYYLTTGGGGGATVFAFGAAVTF